MAAGSVGTFGGRDGLVGGLREGDGVGSKVSRRIRFVVFGVSGGADAGNTTRRGGGSLGDGTKRCCWLRDHAETRPLLR